MSDRALEIMRSCEPYNASMIGKVVADNNYLVTLKSKIGSRRILDLLTGKQLTCIC